MNKADIILKDTLDEISDNKPGLVHSADGSPDGSICLCGHRSRRSLPMGTQITCPDCLFKLKQMGY